MILGLWAIGISLPALLWAIEVSRLARIRGQILTITGQFVVFVRALIVTIAVYGGVVSATILVLALVRKK